MVIDETRHGGNGKIANLINMWPAAKHDVIVLADSDVHVTPHFLERIVAALDAPEVGAVTALYAGFSSGGSLAGRLGAAQINHIFLPGVLVGRLLGRQDCLGAALALRRSTLIRIGGLPALLPHLADDAALGQLVRRLGLRVALAPSLVVTTVSEETLPALFGHELRWARTIRALEPLTYSTSLLQYPVFWALVTVLAADFACGRWASLWWSGSSAPPRRERWPGCWNAAHFRDGCCRCGSCSRSSSCWRATSATGWCGAAAAWQRSRVGGSTARGSPIDIGETAGLGKKVGLGKKLGLGRMSSLGKTGRFSRSINPL